jgi:hypothetical protein
MTYDTCIRQLRDLLEATEPVDQVDAIQKFASACSLVDWATRESEAARKQFSVFLSYYERFALNLPDECNITKGACDAELTKLPMHLPKE